MYDSNSVKEQLIEVLGCSKRYKQPFPSILDLAPGEFFTLDIISRYQDANLGGIKASTIGEINHMSRPAVSQMLNALEKKNYITRVITQKDRRVVLVCLTESGQAVLQKAKKIFLTIVDRIYEELGEEDTKKLIILLNRLQTIFCDDRDYKNKQTT